MISWSTPVNWVFRWVVSHPAETVFITAIIRWGPSRRFLINLTVSEARAEWENWRRRGRIMRQWGKNEIKRNPRLQAFRERRQTARITRQNNARMNQSIKHANIKTRPGAKPPGTYTPKPGWGPVWFVSQWTQSYIFAIENNTAGRFYSLTPEIWNFEVDTITNRGLGNIAVV